MNVRKSSSQPRDWKNSWRDFSEAGGGGVAQKFSEGGPNFLGCLGMEFPDGILPKQTSKKFTLEPPPKLLRSPFGK